MRVLVAGAGPTGLLLAIELARRGVDFRVVDRAPGRSRLSKAMVVQVRTLEVYDALGVAAEAIDAGQPFEAAEFRADGGDPIRLEFDALDSPYPRPLILEQSENERILKARLESLGARVEWTTELVSAERRGEGWRARLRADGGESSADFDVIVGCDGASSTVRLLAGLPFEGGTYEDEFILADVEVDWAYPHDRVRGFISDDGFLAAFPMRGARRYRLIAVRRGYHADEPPTLEEFSAAARALVPVEMHLSDARWLSHYRVHCRGVPRYAKAGLFLAGDAAHVHSPAGGQGMNTGLQDAWNLGWKLGFVSAGHAPRGLLDTYDAERRPFGEFLLARTDTAFRTMLNAGPLLRFVRRHLVPRLVRRRFVQRRLVAAVSQLGIRYAGGPLVDSQAGFRPASPRPGRPEVGARAPEAAFRTVDGRAGSVFGCLRGATGYHLFLLHPDGDDGPARQAGDALRALAGGWLDVHHLRVQAGDGLPHAAIAETYGLREGGYLLVRPDGHLASMGALADLDRAAGVLPA